MDLRKSVSVIIPNYNGRHLLQEYLPHNYEVIDAAGIIYEVIVVDDCSTDDSVTFIRTTYPQINLVINPENKGFSYSCNRGIEAARYELILLLNSDVKLTPSYFDQQWKYFQQPDTFGVMGRIIEMERDNILDAARVPKFKGYKIKTGYFYYSDGADDRLFTFYLSGANALISAGKVKQIGGFYEIFSPFYYEDMDLSIRAWRLNWKCYYEHNSVCRHLVSASTKNYETPRWIKSVYFRNRFYVHVIHLNGWPLVAWHLQITFIDLLPKLLAGQTWIWKSYRQLWVKRKEIREYKGRVKKMMQINKSNISLFEVVERIKTSVKNKKITTFKP